MTALTASALSILSSSISLKKLLSIVLSALCCGFSTVAFAADPRPEIARYVKVYSGENGVTISTLRIGPVSGNEAIVKIVGIDSLKDGRIKKMKVEPRSGGVNYVANVDGRRFVVLVLQGSSGELYLPGSNEPLGRFFYDERLSGQENAERFLSDYLEQK